MMTRSMHVSNPNPQNSHQRYRSVNVIGQNGAENEREKKLLEVLRFGRKVVFDR